MEGTGSVRKAEDPRGDSASNPPHNGLQHEAPQFQSKGEQGGAENGPLARLLALSRSVSLSVLVQSRRPFEWVVIGSVFSAATVLAYCTSYASDSLSIAASCFVVLLSVLFGLYEAQRIIRLDGTAYGWVCALPPFGIVVSALSTVVSLVTTSDVSVDQHVVAAAPLMACAYALVLGALTRRCQTVKPVDTGSLFGLDGGSRLVAGDHVSLKAGELITADVRIDRGSCAVAERRYSPLAALRVKDETEVLYAGSQVIGGEVQGVVVGGSEMAALRRVDAQLSPLIRASEKALTLRLRERALFHLAVALCAALSIAGFWYWRLQTPTEPILAGGLLLFLGIFPWGVQLLSCLEERLVRGWAREGLLVTSPDGVVGLDTIQQVIFEPYILDGGFVRDVTRLEVLDDRIEGRALAGFLGSLLGRAEDPSLLAAAQFCVKQVGTFTPERVVDLREYHGLGICGTVRGVELSVGTEDFLIQRGIQMPVDASLLGDAGSEVICVAIDDDLVGRFWISYGQSSLVHGDVHTPWPHGVRAFVAGELASPETPATLIVGRTPEGDEGTRAAPALLFSLDGSIPLRPSMLLSLTRDLRDLPSVLTSARNLVSAVSRGSIALQILGGLLTLTVFGGVFSGWVPLLLSAVFSVGVWRFVREV
jgi:hypothetical protein